jgi:uncharacterized protein
METSEKHSAEAKQIIAPARGIFGSRFSAASPDSPQDSPSSHLSLNPLAIIQRYYDPKSELYRILLTHSILVTAKALALARQYGKNHSKAEVDIRFIEEAAMLHDIGIFKCHAPETMCHGSEPYIRHGIIGRKILDNEGYPRHALVCERHTGVGLTRDDVAKQNLALPDRDFMPVTIEEKIICLADKFYSKNPEKLFKQKSLGKIRKNLRKRGKHIVRRFDDLCEEITG